MASANPIQIHVVTLFPSLFPGALGVSVLGRALQSDLWFLNVIDLRKYGIGKHKVVDDCPYGGGAGMVIRPDVIDSALQSCSPEIVVCMSPAGSQFSHNLARQYSTKYQSIAIVCGRYEGIDQRVIDKWSMQEIRVGDAVLCGGELPAMVFIEGVIRQLPGVLGSEESVAHESFVCPQVIEHPHFTRPESWNDVTVPEILRSGNHAKIDEWRKKNSRKIK